jgi:hypothetical protein
MIKLDLNYSTVDEAKILKMQKKVEKIHDSIENKTGKGSDFLG